MENDHLALQISGDGCRILLIDRRRNCTWRLDGPCGYRVYDEPKTFLPLTNGRAEPAGPAAMRVRYDSPHGPIAYLWRLESDSATVTL